MDCLGYSAADDWRKECCKLNMQLAIARCQNSCRYVPVKAAASHGQILHVSGAAGESPAPTRT